MLDDDTLQGLCGLAHRLADAAAAASLPWFRASGLAAENKADGQAFDPVTIADRAAETAMREILAAERPDDAVIGEEHGNAAGSSGLSWVLDPIDGTRAFVSGLPVWGTLIALDDGRRGRIGIVDQPFTGERFEGVIGASGGVARLGHRGAWRPIACRGGRGLEAATVFTTSPDIFSPAERAGFEAIRARARLTRYGTDCYAYALVALGQVDLVVESGLNAYDIAAPAALIQAAGGVVTDWLGGDCRHGGRVVAAGNAALHAEALEILSRVPETGRDG